MRRLSSLILGLSTALLTLTVGAAEVQFFQTDTRGSFLVGTLDGVSVDTAGRLSLGMDLERTVALEEPFAFAAAAYPKGGVVVGTGNSGRVLHVSEEGAVRTLFETEESQVFALWVDPDGTVFAGSSPGGKVYRWREGGASGGEAEVFFETGEVYIWSLERRGEDLLVATGTSGKLFQVDAKGKGEVIHDLGAGHVRALSVRPDGSVLIGTAGEGLVQHLRGSGPDVSVRTLYDAEEPEIVALAESPDGTVYAAALASESSLLDLSSSNGSGSSGSSDNGDDDKAEGGSVKVVESGSAGSRRSGYQGPRTRLVEIAPSGAVETLWETDGETVFDLAWRQGRLWVATGLEGQVHSFDGEERVLEATVEDRQIVALVETGNAALEGRGGPTFLTSNAAALYRPTGSERAQGTYESLAFDAGQLARFGTLRWRGILPPGAELEWSFRSGLSATPDATWSSWKKGTSRSVDRATGGVALAEVALAEIVPPGRWVQWRVRLQAGEAAPLVSSVELSYRQVNVAPRITAFQALDPGEVLVRSNFNPSNQVYEPASPNRDGIFTTVGESDGKEDARLKTLWKKGYRSLRWTAEDGNGDDLRYRLSMRPEAASGDDPWMLVAEDLEATHYSFDATALPDGIYRFRLEANDAQDNDAAEGATETQVTGPVLIDHSVPELAGTRWQGSTATVELQDRWNPLRQLEMSVDGGAWKAIQPTDGLLDGRREAVAVVVPEDARLVLLRVMDAAFNVKTFDLKAQRSGKQGARGVGR